MEMLRGWSVSVLTRFKTSMKLFSIVIVQSVKYNGSVRLRPWFMKSRTGSEPCLNESVHGSS